jgi:hypothetical protein
MAKGCTATRRGRAAHTAGTFEGGYPQACAWQDGQRTLLFNDADTAPPGSDAFAVNAAGQVTGRLQYGALDNGIGFLWDGATVRQLPDVADAGVAINASGQVVGPVQLWTGVQVMQLAMLVAAADGGAGWTEVRATALNDAGQIAGTGIRPDGVRRAVLLSPA